MTGYIRIPILGRCQTRFNNSACRGAEEPNGLWSKKDGEEKSDRGKRRGRGGGGEEEVKRMQDTTGGSEE